MPGLDAIVQLTVALLAALLVGSGTRRLTGSPIAGYVLAGLLVGSYTPRFAADRHVAEQLAGVGLIGLMFGVGLRVKLEDVRAVGHVAIPGAIVQALIVTGIAAFVAVQAGWGLSAGLVYGMALSVASTALLVSVLSGDGALHTPAGRLAVGWLVVADLCTALVLVLMPAVFADAGGQTVPVAVGVALAKLAALAGLTIAIGDRVLAWVLTPIARTERAVLLTLAVVAVALGVAVSAAQLLGLSVALGAFLAGLVLGRSSGGMRAAAEAVAMRDAFAVLFFVALGMLFDPGTLLDDPQTLAATLAIVLIGKPLVAVAIVALFRQPRTVAVPAAMALAQIGEFSFLVAAVASDYGVLTADATNTLLAAAIASIVLNPVLFLGVRWVDRRLYRGAPEPALAELSRTHDGRPQGRPSAE